MNLFDKRKYQEKVSAYEKLLDEVSKSLLNGETQEDEAMRHLLAKSYGMLGTTKVLLNQSEITMERDL